MEGSQAYVGQYNGIHVFKTHTHFDPTTIRLYQNAALVLDEEHKYNFGGGPLDDVHCHVQPWNSAQFARYDVDMSKKILKQNWDTMKRWKEDVLSKLKFTAEPGKIYNTEKEGKAAKIGFRIDMQGKNTGVEEYRIQAQRNRDKKAGEKTSFAGAFGDLECKGAELRDALVQSMLLYYPDLATLKGAPNCVSPAILNSATESCSCPAAMVLALNGLNCQCPGGKLKIGNFCVTPATCVAPATLNPASNACTCPGTLVLSRDGRSCGCPFGQVKFGNSCAVVSLNNLCSLPLVRSPDGIGCVCPGGQIFFGNTCVTPPSCVAPAFINPVEPTCACPFPMVLNANGLSCGCTSGQVLSGNFCVNPPACVAPATLNPASNICACHPPMTLTPDGLNCHCTGSQDAIASCMFWGLGFT
jgi:hypothetical protein